MPAAPLSVCQAAPVHRLTVIAPSATTAFGYSVYATTGRPSLPTASEPSKTIRGLGVWLTPLPLAEVPSGRQNGLTPASAAPTVRRIRASTTHVARGRVDCTAPPEIDGFATGLTGFALRPGLAPRAPVSGHHILAK